MILYSNRNYSILTKFDFVVVTLVSCTDNICHILQKCKARQKCKVGTRVSKFAVENVFNSNATIVVLNSTKTTAINDNEKNLAKNEEKLTSP